MSNQKVKEELPFHEEQIKKGKELLKRYNIPNSPFWHIEQDGKHHLIMGKYKFNTQPFDTAEQLHEWMNKDQWNIILSLAICVATDTINQYKQLQNQNNEHN